MVKYFSKPDKEQNKFMNTHHGEHYKKFLPIQAGGVTKYANTHTKGGGTAQLIKMGPFAGRTQGGAERSQIFGTWEYGSGYPSDTGRGVNGRKFPFYFWPVVWSGNGLGNDDRYLHTASEYGPPSNSERPGGPLTTNAFISAITGHTYRVLTDDLTATHLIPRFAAICLPFLHFTSPALVAYPSGPLPLPEQAVQYYRASSIALTLDGYNNTAALLSSGSFSAIPLPSDSAFDPALACLNTTIGDAALLVAELEFVNTFLSFMSFIFVLAIIMIYLLYCLLFLIIFFAYLCDTCWKWVKSPERALLLPSPPHSTASPPVVKPRPSSVRQMNPAPSSCKAVTQNVGRSHDHDKSPPDEDTQSQWSWNTTTCVADDDDITLENGKQGQKKV